MSVHVSSLVYRKRVGSPIRKAVLAFCADKASDDGRGVWVSKGTIAKALECGRSTVIRTMNEFVAEGLLVPVGHRPGKNGDTVEYDISMSALSALDNLSDDKPPVPQRDQSRRETSPALDQSTSGTPTSPAAGPKPSYQPSFEKETEARAPVARRKPAATSPIPEGWDPEDSGRLYATSLGLSEAEIEQELPEFRVFWADRGDRRSAQGWDNTWKRRCRDLASNPRRRSTSHQPKGKKNGLAEGFFAAMREPGLANGPGDDDVRALLPARY